MKKEHQKARDANQDSAKKQTCKKKELSTDSHRAKMVLGTKKAQGCLRSSVFRPFWVALLIGNTAVGFPQQYSCASALDAINHCPHGLPLSIGPPHGTRAMPWSMDFMQGGNGKWNNQSKPVAWPISLALKAKPSSCFLKNNQLATKTIARIHGPQLLGGDVDVRSAAANLGSFFVSAIALKGSGQKETKKTKGPQNVPHWKKSRVMSVHPCLPESWAR